MKIDMVKWIGIGEKIVPLVITAVNAVEKLADSAKGKDKQDAAVDLVSSMLAVVEGGVNKDLLNDAAVQEAVRKVIDAVVALQNVIATRAAATSKIA